MSRNKPVFGGMKGILVMKKVLAVVLTLVIAFSMSVMAFADAADAEVAEAAVAADTATDEASVKGILDTIVGLFKKDANEWNAIEDIVIRIIDFIENIGNAISSSDVLGAVSDLEAKISGFKLDGDFAQYVKNLINNLKQKIKDLYCGERATTVEVTEASASANTGSTSYGIVAFAAISVATAAAYVCTKKRA